MALCEEFVMFDLFMTRFHCVYILLQVEYDLHVYIFKWNMVYYVNIFKWNMMHYVRILVLNCVFFMLC